MKASALVEQLVMLIEDPGDQDVMIDCDQHGLREIEDCDLPVDDPRFVIWAAI